MYSVYLSISNNDELAHQSLSDRLHQMLDTALKSRQGLEEAFLLMTAYFIFCKGEFSDKNQMYFLSLFLEPNKKLLHTIVWLPSRLFSEYTMQLCIMCWNWILVAREDTQLDVSYCGVVVKPAFLPSLFPEIIYDLLYPNFFSRPN